MAFEVRCFAPNAETKAALDEYEEMKKIPAVTNATIPLTKRWMWFLPMLDFFSPVQYILSVSRRIPSTAFCSARACGLLFLRRSALTEFFLLSLTFCGISC